MEKKEEANNVQDIELIDIEDIVPTDGNSLFLSCARAVLYMSHKNPTFIAAIQACCDIDLTQHKTDIGLQALIRSRICNYFCKNGVVSDTASNSFQLREAYSKHFNGNIYDFLVQIYQLGINNFANNALYRKYALISISQLLNMKIFYKRANGQWKMYESRPSLDNTKQSITVEKANQLNYLNDCVIYLQEFRTESSNKSVKKVIRILLDKKLWLSKFANNSKICMNFAQFNDETELKSYQRHYFTFHPKMITDIFTGRNDQANCTKVINLAFTKKIFSVFLHSAPVQLMLNAESNTHSTLVHSTIIDSTISNSEDIEFTQEFNTIGKQFRRFEVMGPGKLYQFINHIWGCIATMGLFNDEFVLHKYSLIEHRD